jgi:CO dehydrogenase maturation factor
MKIVVMGKGGSGKSSLSWLLSKYISKSKKVVAIDADHNMDLTSNLGILVDSDTPTIHRIR